MCLSTQADESFDIGPPSPHNQARIKINPLPSRHTTFHLMCQFPHWHFPLKSQPSTENDLRLKFPTLQLETTTKIPNTTFVLELFLLSECNWLLLIKGSSKHTKRSISTLISFAKTSAGITIPDIKGNKSEQGWLRQMICFNKLSSQLENSFFGSCPNKRRRKIVTQCVRKWELHCFPKVPARPIQEHTGIPTLRKHLSEQLKISKSAL